MEATFRSGTAVLGKYRIESPLGRDGMYVCLRVTHLQLGGDLVLRMLLPETATSLAIHARMLRDAQAAARIRGEHAARIVDVGISSDGVPYMVSEVVHGVDLAAELARRGALLPAEAVDYVLQACDALAEAHAHGVVHRNLRLGNVLLTGRPDGSLLIKVADFGISPTAAPGAQASARAGDPDPLVDVRAIAAVLYECLTGQPPLPPGASPGDPLRPLGPEIPPGLGAVVLRALDPRTGSGSSTGSGSIAELSAALAPYAHDHAAAALLAERARLWSQGAGSAIEPMPAPGPYPMIASTGPPPAARARRRIAIVAVIALGASIGGIAAAALIRPSRSRGGDPRPAPVIAAPAPSPGPATAPSPPPTTAALATAGPSDADRAQQLAKCAELQTQHRWQELDDCASRLAQLGLSAKAEQLRAAAHQEQQDQLLDDQAQRALEAGQLASAQATLAQIDAGSVYLAALRERFAAAEHQRTDEAAHKARALASAHDCAALRRLVGQLADTSTDRVVAAARDVTCSESAGPPARPVRATARGAGHAPERIAEAGAPATRPRKVSCETVDVPDLMTRAATQYDAGEPATALSFTRVALGCQQTDRMYWLAVMYACAAHDLAAARQFFPRVAAGLQSGLERKCQQSNLDVRTR